MRWVFAIQVALTIALRATVSGAECDLSRSDALPAATGDVWIEAAPARLARSLQTKGVAFPRQGARSDCPDLLPAVVVFDHPPERVFSLLIQTERQSEFMTSLTGLESISRGPDRHVDLHRIRVLFTEIQYHLRHRWDARSRRIWWELSPRYPNDLREITGYWELRPLGGGRSLGFYGATVDVGAAIPKRMQASLTRKNMRRSIRDIRSWVNLQGRDER